MRKDQQVSFAIYVLISSLVVAVIGVVLFIMADEPQYVSADQIRSYVATQPAECAPIVRARLKRRLMQDNTPLRMSNMRSVLREIDIEDCGIASRQLEALEDVGLRNAN